MSWLGRSGCDLDLLTSTSEVVCGHVGTNDPRGRANKKFKGECCLKKYNTLEIVG